MGQFLTVGLCTEFSFSTKKFKESYTEEMFNEKLQKKFDLSLYNKTYLDYESKGKNPKYIRYTIKPDIFTDNILDFVKSQFKLYENTDDDINDISRAIKGKTFNEIIELADDKKFYHFQLLPYYGDYVRDFRTGIIYIDVTLIQIFGAGKIIMETYNELFNYFENVIKETNRENPLRNAVRVMISQ